MDCVHATRNSGTETSRNDLGAFCCAARLRITACASGMPHPASCRAMARTRSASILGMRGSDNAAARSPASAAWEGCVIIQQLSQGIRCKRSTARQAEMNSVSRAGCAGGSNGRRIMVASAGTSFGNAARNSRGPGRSTARRRLLHSIQKLLERHGIIALGIF